MSQDKLKEAFSKIKEDIFGLQSQISEIKRTIAQTDRQTQDQTNQTDRHINQTVPQEVRGLKPQNLHISTGNEGVQTDRQTNRQTDKNIQNPPQTSQEVRLNTPNVQQSDSLTKIEKVSEILDSLDDIKKTLRSQFKKLTPQEMLVFSTIYQLEEEGYPPDYRLVSNKTNLSESSIRDYVQKLTKKQVPVDKIKHNNKKVTLTIPQSFKKLASLSTILTLREL